MTTDWILGQFGTKRNDAGERYKEFVRSGINEEPPWKKLKGQTLLGSEDFIDKFRDLLSQDEDIKEIPRLQRYISRPRIADLFKSKKELTKQARNESIYSAHIRYGYTLKEIADYLDVHYTTVSKAINSGKD